MFPRFAAKGPGALLGLLAVLWPAGAAVRVTRTPLRTTPVTATAPAKARPAKTVVRIAKPAVQTVKTVVKPVKSVKEILKPTGLHPYAVMAKRTHGGGQYDHNQDMGENNPAVEDPRFRVSNEIEPTFLTGFANYLLSTDRGFVTSGLLHAYDNYPAGDNEPQFLVGPDYHINLSTATNQIVLDPDRTPLNLEPDASGKDRGEQFEPAVIQPATSSTASGMRLAFSAFLPGTDDTDAYKLADQENIPHTGMPVRVIRVADKVLSGDSTINYTLKAHAYTSYTVDEEAYGVYTPDASPEWYPGDRNQIVFSSLRGFDKDDASTHYASIYVWTPETLGPDQKPPRLLIGQNYSFPGPDGTPVFPFKNKSLLYPKFSPDGRYLSFTVADVKYEPVDDHGNLPDIVYDIDVTKAALNTPSNAVFVKSARIWITEPVDFGGLRMPDPLRELDKLQPLQVTTFTDSAGNASRDLMSFWSPQNQMGFSSDRKDTTGSGLPDSVETDPTKALFDIYTFPFPFTPNQVENLKTMKDLAPKRATLGSRPALDDSNELKGTWGPVNPLSTGNDVLMPNILYQADDTAQADPTSGEEYHDWDIFLTDTTQTATYTKSLLVGVPVITRNPDLSAKDLDNLKRTHRAGFPNDFVTISVQLNPAQLTYDNEGKVNTRVFVDVKDANQVKWEVLTEQLDPNIFSYNWHETSYWPVKIDGADAAAFDSKYGGTANPPRIGSRIQLDLDSSKGTGWFTARWYTPVTASDYLIDVRVVTPDDTSYNADNIAGFSTVPFVAMGKALLVSDFMAGQKAIPMASGTRTTAGEQTESYVTYRPHADVAWNGTDSRPVVFSYGNREWNTLGPLLEFQTATVVGSGSSAYVVPGSLSTTNPLVQNVSAFNNVYNIWRVQCREPITVDDVKDGNGNVIRYGVLKDYLPYTVTQPGAPSSAQTARTQVVADRCVLWYAPHAGQLNGNAGENSRQGYLDNLGVGTIARLETQAEIVKFLAANGRMLISGDDVANIVSATGSITAPPLLKAFKVKFHSHYAFDAVGVYAHNRQDLKTNAGGGSANPLFYKTWEIHLSAEPNPTGDSGAELWLSPWDDGQGWHPPHGDCMGDDGAWTNLYMDAVVKDSTAPFTTTILDFLSPGETPPESLPEVGTPVAGVQFEQSYDPSKLNTSPSKTLFFSIGLEGLHRKYDGPRSDQLYHAKNPLAQITHNAMDFLTTGGFVGHVTLTNNVTPVKGVLVWVVDRYNYIANGVIRGTGITDESGAYQIDGLDSSNYQLYVYKTGYAGQNPNYYDIDSGWDDPTLEPGYSEVNLLMYPVAPGTLKGVVVDKTNTNVKLAGATVHITDIQLTVDRTVVSDANGNYRFDNLPAGLYNIDVPEYTDPNTSQVYAPYATTTPVQVQSGSVDTIYDIQLSKRVVPPSPATVIVTVNDASASPTVPAAGATVSLIDTITGQLAATLDGGMNPGTTLEDGTVTFHVKAGQYKVTADFQTYKQQNTTIVAQPDNDANPPTNPTRVTFNFGGVLHVFTGGKVLLASAPYDYSGTQASPLTFSSVLNLTAQQLANSVVGYDGPGQKWVYYPTYPADTFRLGRGYGFNLPADGKVMVQGTSASATSSNYVIRGETGWNLIGNPYTQAVTWSGADAASVRVALRDDAKQTKLTIAEAMTKGWILSPLWGGASTDANGNAVYSGYQQTNTLQPWQAFWVKAGQPVLFYVPQPISGSTSMASRAAAAAVHQPLFPAANTWALNITATAMSLTDDGLAIGLSRGATSGVDAGLDLAKPGLLNAPGQYLFTSFNDGRNNTYATDVRGVGGANAWTFTVNTNLNMRDVTLTWKPMGTLPNGTLTLVDVATGSRTNMVSASQYTFRSARNGGVRAFRVEYRPGR